MPRTEWSTSLTAESVTAGLAGTNESALSRNDSLYVESVLFGGSTSDEALRSALVANAGLIIGRECALSKKSAGAVAVDSLLRAVPTAAVYLDLANSNFSGQADLGHLANLKAIDLSGCPVRPTALTRLLKLKQSIQALSVAGCPSLASQMTIDELRLWQHVPANELAERLDWLTEVASLPALAWLDLRSPCVTLDDIRQRAPLLLSKLSAGSLRVDASIEHRLRQAKAGGYQHNADAVATMTKSQLQVCATSLGITFSTRTDVEQLRALVLETGVRRQYDARLAELLADTPEAHKAKLNALVRAAEASLVSQYGLFSPAVEALRLYEQQRAAVRAEMQHKGVGGSPKNGNSAGVKTPELTTPPGVMNMTPTGAACDPFRFPSPSPSRTGRSSEPAEEAGVIEGPGQGVEGSTVVQEHGARDPADKETTTDDSKSSPSDAEVASRVANALAAASSSSSSSFTAAMGDITDARLPAVISTQIVPAAAATSSHGGGLFTPQDGFAPTVAAVPVITPATTVSTSGSPSEAVLFGFSPLGQPGLHLEAVQGGALSLDASGTTSGPSDSFLFVPEDPSASASTLLQSLEEQDMGETQEIDYGEQQDTAAVSGVPGGEPEHSMPLTRISSSVPSASRDRQAGVKRSASHAGKEESLPVIGRPQGDSDSPPSAPAHSTSARQDSKARKLHDSQDASAVVHDGGVVKGVAEAGAGIVPIARTLQFDGANSARSGVYNAEEVAGVVQQGSQRAATSVNTGSGMLPPQGKRAQNVPFKSPVPFALKSPSGRSTISRMGGEGARGMIAPAAFTRFVDEMYVPTGRVGTAAGGMATVNKNLAKAVEEARSAANPRRVPTQTTRKAALTGNGYAPSARTPGAVTPATKGTTYASAAPLVSGERLLDPVYADAYALKESISMIDRVIAAASSGARSLPHGAVTSRVRVQGSPSKEVAVIVLKSGAVVRCDAKGKPLFREHSRLKYDVLRGSLLDIQRKLERANPLSTSASTQLYISLLQEYRRVKAMQPTVPSAAGSDISSEAAAPAAQLASTETPAAPAEDATAEAQPGDGDHAEAGASSQGEALSQATVAV